MNDYVPNYSITFPATSITVDTSGMTLLNPQRNKMNVKPSAVRTRAGYLPQIYVDDVIVWEGRARKTHDKAMSAARARISEKSAEVFA